MRHLGSLLFGLVLAPVIWFLAALGQFRLTQALPAPNGTGGSVLEITLGALLMAAGGVWLGLLLSSRISPLGPGIAGLLWLALGAAFALDIDVIINALPDGPTGQQNLYELPLRNGYAFLIGVGLLVPMFSPRRWRRTAVEEPEDEPRYVPFGPVPEPVRQLAGDADLGARRSGEYTNGSRGVVGRVNPTGEVRRPDFTTDSRRPWSEAPERSSGTPWDR